MTFLLPHPPPLPPHPPRPLPPCSFFSWTCDGCGDGGEGGGRGGDDWSILLKTKSCTYYTAFKTELETKMMQLKTIAIHHFTYGSKNKYGFLGGPGVVLKNECI